MANRLLLIVLFINVAVLADREMKQQVLDSMDIERERGITIKAQTVKLNYQAKDGENYILKYY